jgi:hypothetical protein
MITRMCHAFDALRRRRGIPEGGLSLVELLIATFLAAMVTAMVVGLYAGMQRTVTLSGAINDSTKASSLGMQELSDVLRFAVTNPVQGQAVPDPAFPAADNEALSVYTYADSNSAAPRPMKVTFSLDAQRRLIETRYSSYPLATGYWAFNTTPVSTQVLTGTIIAPSAGQPYLFTYLDASNAPMTVGTAGLTTSQTPLVASVKVTIKVATTSKGAPVTLQNTVGLPNLGLTRTGQGNGNSGYAG